MKRDSEREKEISMEGGGERKRELKLLLTNLLQRTGSLTNSCM